MSSIFGTLGQQSNTNNNTGGSSLFGTNNNQSSLFGGNNNNNQNTAGTSSLFGGNNNNTQNTTATSSLFGGNNNTQNQNTSSLFGANNQQQPQQHQQQQQQPQQQQQQPFNMSTPTTLTLPQQTDLARLRLSQAGLANPQHEKPLLEQARTLITKWDPNSQDTLLQSHLYNLVNAAYAPFYHASPQEREADWERALSEAPSAPNESERFVPVLVRGFWDLGKRVEVQVAAVREMRGRLHEMVNSLEEVGRRCGVVLGSSVEEARRRHAAVRERTLRLAVKVQVLRNRGFALDGVEEELRMRLGALEARVRDPAFAGREEEVWARMVALRERARWVEEEGVRVGRAVDEQRSSVGGGGGVSEEILAKTKRILQDYDGQLAHLAREVQEVGMEFEEYQKGRQG